MNASFRFKNYFFLLLLPLAVVIALKAYNSAKSALEDNCRTVCAESTNLPWNPLSGLIVPAVQAR